MRLSVLIAALCASVLLGGCVVLSRTPEEVTANPGETTLSVYEQDMLALASMAAASETAQIRITPATGAIQTLAELYPLGKNGFEYLPKTIVYRDVEYIRCAIYVPAGDCAVLKNGRAFYLYGKEEKKEWIHAYTVRDMGAGECIAVDFDVLPVGEMLVYRHPDTAEGTLEAKLS